MRAKHLLGGSEFAKWAGQRGELAPLPGAIPGKTLPEGLTTALAKRGGAGGRSAAEFRSVI